MIRRLLLSVLVSYLPIVSVSYAEGVTLIQKAAENLIKSGDPVALSVSVIHKGNVYQWHYGEKELNKGKKPDGDTLYEVGSVSKVFTALLLGHAVSEGDVKLDTPVQDLLPTGFKIPQFKENKISLLHLSTHTSRLPRIPDDFLVGANLVNPYAHFDEDTLKKSLAKHHINSKPGSKPSAYSNFGVGLLGYALGSKNGGGYEQYLDESVFSELGMDRSRVKFAEDNNQAQGYSLAHKPESYWDFGTLAGAGGVRSTLNDMTKFAKFCLRPAGHSLESALKLTLEPKFKEGNQSQCLGWVLAADGSSYIHSGMTGGFSAYLAFNRQYDVAVCVLSSSSSHLIPGFGERLLVNFASGNHQEFKTDSERKIKVMQKHLDSIAGVYEKNGLRFEVVTRNQRLFVKYMDQAFSEVVAVNKNEFKYKDVNASLKFTGNQITLLQGGMNYTATKQ